MTSHVQLVFHLPTPSMTTHIQQSEQILNEQSDYHQDQLQRL